MNLQIFTLAKNFIRCIGCQSLTVATLFLVYSLPAAAWEVDLSRRFQVYRQAEREPAQEKSNQAPGFFERLIDVEPASQDIVILNTQTGFVPNSLQLRKGQNYRVHVVNVNNKERNVSFILDAFSEHHATYYGEIKSFTVSPKKEGIYSYQCPETASQGRLVVFDASPIPSQPEVQLRQPASGSQYGPK